MTRVTCILPFHNPGRAFLAKAMRSIQGQSRPDFLCLLVDDGSTDDSRALALAMAAEDRRFALAATAGRIGKARAVKAVERLVNTEYVCIVDSDDWLSQDAFYETVKALDDDEDESPAVLTDMYVSNEDGTECVPCKYNGQPYSYEAMHRVRLPIHLLMMRTAFFHGCGGLDEEMELGHMFDLRLRLANEYGPLLRVTKPLYFYRRHAGQATQARAEAMRAAVATARERHGRLNADKP